MMEEKNERHTYICTGVSREAFQDVGLRATTEDPTLTYFVHDHPYDPYGPIPCGDLCQVIRNGKSQFVTQMDDASQDAGR